MKKNLLLGLVGITIINTSIPSAEACGPYFQPSYMETQTPYEIYLSKEVAIKRIVNDMKDLFDCYPDYPCGLPQQEGIRKDFESAVNSRLSKYSPEERSQLINKYLEWYETREIEKLDFLPSELEEFYLYHRGVNELNIDCEAIPKSWTKLLSLPKEQRLYRTTWALFTMGNAFDDKYYKLCLDAYNEGYVDTIGLARISYERGVVGKDFVSQFKWWAFDIENSREWEFNYYNSELNNQISEKLTLELLEDPIGRELLLIFAPHNIFFIENADKYKFRNIDILAFCAYSQGDIEKAQKYISLLEKPTLLSYWIEAKIARLNGDMELTIEKLRNWLKLADEIDVEESALILVDKDTAWENDVYGLLGNALVYKKDFVEAAKLFARIGQTDTDLSYIIDKYLSLDDLIELAPLHEKFSESAFKEAFRQNKFDVAIQHGNDLQKSCLKKYLEFINKSEDKSLSNDERALALYNAAVIMRYNGMDLCGSNLGPDNARWKGYYSSGDEVYSEDYYFEIYSRYGYESSLDWIDAKIVLVPDCSSKEDTCHLDEKWGYYIYCEKHAKLYGFKKSPCLLITSDIDFTKVPRYIRFHYRVRAAKLLLKAGELVEDKDLNALINMFGGFCMFWYGPSEMDIFYKRLVKGSRGNIWGDKADELRWFPTYSKLFVDFRNDKAYFCSTMEEVKKLMSSENLKTSDSVIQFLYKLEDVKKLMSSENLKTVD